MKRKRERKKFALDFCVQQDDVEEEEKKVYVMMRWRAKIGVPEDGSPTQPIISKRKARDNWERTGLRVLPYMIMCGREREREKERRRKKK